MANKSNKVGKHVSGKGKNIPAKRSTTTKAAKSPKKPTKPTAPTKSDKAQAKPQTATKVVPDVMPGAPPPKSAKEAQNLKKIQDGKVSDESHPNHPTVEQGGEQDTDGDDDRSSLDDVAEGDSAVPDEDITPAWNADPDDDLSDDDDDLDDDRE